MSRDLTEAPVQGLIKKMALPASIGFFFNTMYNIVDTYFGGQISTTALAAMSLSFPVFFLIIIFDSGTSTGTTALLANIIGEGDHKKAERYTGQVLSFGVLVSILLTFAGLLLSPALFKLLGAQGEYLALALSFMNVIFYGSIFFMMIGVINSVLQATGNTTTYRNFLIFGFALNCLLDPWFLYGGLGVPALGLSGIALATVTVEFVGCIYIYCCANRTGLSDRKPNRGQECLAGHRSAPGYIRGSRHVPPPAEAVTDSLSTLLDLLEDEESPIVRAVLGHWLFGYIHPYMDGNGRLARFLMNILMASVAYPWTIVRATRRKAYLDGLEAASAEQNIVPFASFIREEMSVDWSKEPPGR
jgi:hypothetical protein